MSIHIDDLRDIAANHGWSVCEDAADEIELLEKQLQQAENNLMVYVQHYGPHWLGQVQ